MRQIDERLLDSILDTLKGLTLEIKRLTAVDADTASQLSLAAKDIEALQRDLQEVKRRIRYLREAEKARRDKENVESGERNFIDKVITWGWETGSKLLIGALLAVLGLYLGS